MCWRRPGDRQAVAPRHQEEALANRGRSEVARAQLAPVNAAWLQLGTRYKLLLRDFYVLERPVNVICREQSIKHWPASHWRLELNAAQLAIKALIGTEGT